MTSSELHHQHQRRKKETEWRASLLLNSTAFARSLARPQPLCPPNVSPETTSYLTQTIVHRYVVPIHVP